MKLNLMASFALVAGMALSGTSLLAGESYWNRDRDQQYDRQDIRRDSRDLRYDYIAIQRLREEIALDRARLEEDYRCGRRWAAAMDRRELERDQRRLEEMYREVRSDRRDLWGDYRDQRRDDRDYRNRW